MFSVPSIPPEALSDWVQPGAVVAIVGLLLAALRGFRAELKDMRTDFKEELKDMRTGFKEELRASEARQQKQMDAIKEELSDMRTEFKAELRASQTRQQEQVDEIRETNKLLGEKVDRLIEVFLSAQVKAA